MAFRKHTLLSLDDGLYALQPTIPNLTRSSIAACNAIALLTYNGIQFVDLPKNRSGATVMRGHLFDRSCWANNIEHRLTKLNHLWANGQAERMNRTLKEATVNRYYYQSHPQLSEHLDAFISGYNFTKRLKSRKSLTPREFIVKTWSQKPELFYFEPN